MLIFARFAARLGNNAGKKAPGLILGRLVLFYTVFQLNPRLFREGLPLLGEGLVGDDRVQAVHAAEEDVGVALEFRVVRHQVTAAGVPDHDLTHMCLA